MSHVSLYRKYRPESFNQVVGQDNIVTTLENAISADKVSHAYIFSGPRGCGKTSIAKIFAKKVNCTCQDNSCHTCEVFQKGEVSDVWEIDAASNNGVDEIRRIIENVNYTPMDLKYKVYIIDEVHMLSKAAFNALLKTLEEPPKHVIFILATTEIHKIPLTVLSRCQRFDFKRITIEKIVERLTEVLDLEKIEYETDALVKVAMLADGGMRDALSLIEKVRTYNNIVTLDAVNQSLQLVGVNDMDELVNLIINSDINQVISKWQYILSLGIDENKFILDVQYYLRDLLLAGNDKYERFSIIKLLKSFNELESKLQFTNNFSLVIEVYLIEMNHQLSQQGSTKNSPVIEYDDYQTKLKAQMSEIKSKRINTNSKSEATKLQSTRNSDVIDFLKADEIDPIKENPHVEGIKSNVQPVKNVVVDKRINTENIIILDVLKSATIDAKKELVSIFASLQTNLEAEGKYGIAKFFEYADVNAASEVGCVLTIDANIIESYQKRLPEIEDIFHNYASKKGKIFLLERSKWQQKRPEYIQKIKEMKNNDILELANGEFGTNIVTKI